MKVLILWHVICPDHLMKRTYSNWQRAHLGFPFMMVKFGLQLFGLVRKIVKKFEKVFSAGTISTRKLFWNDVRSFSCKGARSWQIAQLAEQCTGLPTAQVWFPLGPLILFIYSFLSHRFVGIHWFGWTLYESPHEGVKFDFSWKLASCHTAQLHRLFFFYWSVSSTRVLIARMQK